MEKLTGSVEVRSSELLSCLDEAEEVGCSDRVVQLIEEESWSGWGG